MTVPVDLRALLDPSHTAVVTMEVQRGVVGPGTMISALADQVAADGVLPAIGRVCAAARAAGARVVHCTAEFREDKAGQSANSPMQAMLAKQPHTLVTGSAAVEVMPELDPQPSDITVARWFGLTPFPGTALDQTLRNLGVRTIVATGVSVNLGVLGLCMEAVDRGYSVVLPRDCVAGVPAAYADDVVRHTLSLLATVTTADDVVAALSS